MGSTPRELTLKLIQQHEFLLHRCISLTDTLQKYNGLSEIQKKPSEEDMTQKHNLSTHNDKTPNRKHQEVLIIDVDAFA